MNQNPQEIKAIKIFRDLPLEDIIKIAGDVKECDYQKDNLIITPHEKKVGKIYLVKSGEVSVYQVSPEGQKLVLDILGPGDVFGFSAAEETLPYFVKAVHDAHIGILPMETFWEYVEQHPEVAKKVIQDLSSRMDQLQQQIADMAYSSAATRVYQTLKRLGQQYGKPVEDGVEIYKRFTHEQVAQFAGLTRESTSKAIKELVRGGCVKVNMFRRFVLTDVKE